MNGLGLLEKFKLQQQTLLLNENEIILKNENINQIFEKINLHKEFLNLKEDQIIHYENSQKDFFDFFENQFSQIYNFKDLQEIKSKILELEEFINLNKDKIFSSNMKPPKQIISQLSNYFAKLDQNLNFSKKSENQSIENLKEFSKNIKEFAIDSIYHNIDINKINEIYPKRNYLKKPQNQLTNKKPNIRRADLFSTAYIKKSKSQFGIDDDIFSPESKMSRIRSNKKDRKLILRNFLQIYLVKENDIFSQSHFSKYDRSLLQAYTKYKFYEIKLCVSLQDSFEEIRNYLEFLKSLFTKFIIIYKQDKGRNFIKIIICGVGKKQSLMKNNLIKFVNTQVKKDCLIKISFYSNIFDSMKSNLENIIKNRKNEDSNVNIECMYYYHSNFNEEMLRKMVRKIYKKINK